MEVFPEIYRPTSTDSTVPLETFGMGLGPETTNAGSVVSVADIGMRCAKFVFQSNTMSARCTPDFCSTGIIPLKLALLHTQLVDCIPIALVSHQVRQCAVSIAQRTLTHWAHIVLGNVSSCPLDRRCVSKTVTDENSRASCSGASQTHPASTVVDLPIFTTSVNGLSLYMHDFRCVHCGLMGQWSCRDFFPQEPLNTVIELIQ